MIKIKTININKIIFNLIMCQITQRKKHYKRQKIKDKEARAKVEEKINLNLTFEKSMIFPIIQR